MSCKYKNECPSYSGWCEGPKQDFSKCVEFLISAVEAERSKRKVLYICDRRACDECIGADSNCTHTTDIRHAKKFESFKGAFLEMYPRSK